MELVLVHGLSGSPRWWREVVPELERRRRVHVVEVPRYHRSFLPEQAADWLAEELEGLGRPVLLVGHSLGGLTAARLAYERPELLAGLVLIAPAGVPSRSLLWHALPLLRSLRLLSPHFLRTLAADAWAAGPESILRGLWESLGDRLGHELEEIEAQTLLVWGRHDLLVPARLAEEWQRRLKDCRLVLLEAGHVPMVEDPLGLAAALESFAVELEGRG